MCHCISHIGFWVPDKVWEKAINPFWYSASLCLVCFVSQADEKLIKWDNQIKFYPISLRTHLENTDFAELIKGNHKDI